MILADHQIRARTNLPKGHPGRLVIEPFVDYGCVKKGEISYGLSSAGYDLRLGHDNPDGPDFLVFHNAAGVVIDPKNFNPDNFIKVQAKKHEKVIIPPNCFALAASVEHVEVPRDILILTLGKSTYARCAVNLNFTPFEPSWRGKVTVEIINGSPLPVAVYAGEGIAQMVFMRLDEPCERSYDEKPGKKFQDQPGLVGPGGVLLTVSPATTES